MVLFLELIKGVISVYGIHAAMGYILHAIFVVGTDHAELKEFYEEFKTMRSAKNIEQDSFSNADTTLFTIEVLKGYGVKDERIELIAQVLHWLFDSNTVGEAEELHNAYRVILRVNTSV